MDKLRMQSSNGVEDNIMKIAQLFPDCVTETVDERSGQPKHLIDFEKLKQNLSDSVMSERAERYQFTWPDKSKAILLANSPINATLRPCREDSIDFDNTQNLYIEGDNLDVLKCLKETYLHKVKMIYIDPPYNTGNDFVYEDDFAQSSEEYLANSGQFDEQGNRMFTNAESNGRFHTDWLNMIYPRLKVARDLLTDDGVIFISIDENEIENLLKLCKEIFGANNYISQFVWQNKKGGGNDSTYVAIEHEYILAFAKNINSLEAFFETYSDEYIKRYKEQDEKGKFFWDTFKRKSGKQYYPITCPDGTVLQYDEDGNEISWLRSQKRFETDKKEGEIRFAQTTNGWSVQFKQRMPKGKKPRSIFTTNSTVLDDKGTTSTGSEDVYCYFKKEVFSNPKPIELITYFLGFGLTDNEIVMDFFSGSATTAEAVMRNNIGGNHNRFILIQLPELIDSTKKATSENSKKVVLNAISVLDELKKPHYITELAKERIRRAGKKIKEESPLTTQDLDTGFRVLKLDSTNMQDIYYSPKDISQADLFSQVDNVKPDRTGEDLLFQVMLELGATLDSKIETTTVAGKTIYNVAEGYLVACFDPDVTDEVVKSIAQMQPAYAVLRDTSMKDDSTATNFEQIFKTYSPDTVTRIL